MKKDFQSGGAKKLARLAAVQALYQSSYEQDDLALILKQYTKDPSLVFNDDDTPFEITQKPDTALMGQIAHGVIKNKAALMAMVSGAVDQKMNATRMEKLLRAILLSGAFELYNHTSIDAALIISDYVDVTKAFFNGKEVGLVNAILDKLAQKLRGA